MVNKLLHNRLVVFGLMLLIVWLLPYLYPQTFFVHTLQIAGLYYILLVGLNLLVGYSNQISLGHAGFFAIGAYTSAILSTRLGLSFWLTTWVAVAFSAGAGVVVALLSLRSKGPYLAMVTIAFGEVIAIVANRWMSVTNGPAGIADIPRPYVLGQPLGEVAYYYLIAFTAALIWLLTYNLIHSRFGRTMKAIGQSEIASEVLGVNVRSMKMIVFAISAAYAGLAGVFFAHQNHYINSDTFTADLSILALIGVIVGGAGTELGPLLGVGMVTILPIAFARLADYHLLIFGTILLLSMLLLPDGIGGLFMRFRFGRRTAGAEGGPVQTVRLAATPKSSQDPLVETERLGKDFDGLKAVSDLNLSVNEGVVHGLIGPNGSGKSTVVNLLSGAYRASTGRVLLRGRDVTGEPPHVLALAGVTRTFQNLQLFGGLTVLENVLVGSHRHFKSGFISLFVNSRGSRTEEEHARGEALAILDLVGLRPYAGELASNLPYGKQRLVEIARAVALQPELLILDEPAAGCGPGEITEIMTVISELSRSGMAILVVEHHMELIMELCDTVTVMDFGNKIAEGIPSEITRNPQVIEAYLGGEEVQRLVAGRGA